MLSDAAFVLLQDMKEFLTEETWVQGIMYRVSADGDVMSTCMIGGGIYCTDRTAMVRKDAAISDPVLDEAMDACKHVAQEHYGDRIEEWLRLMRPDGPLMTQPKALDSWRVQLPFFNDHPDTTLADVHAVIEKAQVS